MMLYLCIGLALWAAILWTPTFSEVYAETRREHGGVPLRISTAFIAILLASTLWPALVLFWVLLAIAKLSRST